MDKLAIVNGFFALSSEDCWPYHTYYKLKIIKALDLLYIMKIMKALDLNYTDYERTRSVTSLLSGHASLIFYPVSLQISIGIAFPQYLTRWTLVIA